jgi:arylsulfatase A-like enzyme
MRGVTVNASNNAPLRGSKRTTLEGGVRVPFVMHWKGKLPAGKVYEQPVIQLDILPTALAAAGAEGPLEELDGVNLLPYLRGEKSSSPHETLYWRFGAQMAIRHGDWKLVRYDTAVETDQTSPGARGSAVSPLKLYNLANDIGESRDLSEKNPEKVKELQSLYAQWNAQLVPPLWGGANARRRANR